MEDKIRRFLLVMSILTVITGIILFYLGAISWAFFIVFMAAGLILAAAGMYNWEAGTDFSSKQETPLENEGIEYNNDMKAF